MKRKLRKPTEPHHAKWSASLFWTPQQPHNSTRIPKSSQSSQNGPSGEETHSNCTYTPPSRGGGGSESRGWRGKPVHQHENLESKAIQRPITPSLDKTTQAGSDCCGCPPLVEPSAVGRVLKERGKRGLCAGNVEGNLPLGGHWGLLGPVARISPVPGPLYPLGLGPR